MRPRVEIDEIPFRFDGQSLRLTCSLGIAFYPQHAANAEELIAHADAAMYQAKEAGKNAWRIYRPDLDASREMVIRLSWNERISHALVAPGAAPSASHGSSPSPRADGD